MKNINIIFDDDFSDTDIISVPDDLAGSIDDIAQEFLFWEPPEDDPNYWMVIDGRKCRVAETDGFIKWLNQRYCKDKEQAFIVVQHTDYCPDNISVEF